MPEHWMAIEQIKLDNDTLAAIWKELLIGNGPFSTGLIWY